MFFTQKFLLCLFHTLSVINRPLFIFLNDSLSNNYCSSAIQRSCPLRMDEITSTDPNTYVNSTTIRETELTIISSTTEYYTSNPSRNELYNESMLNDELHIPNDIQTSMDSTTMSRTEPTIISSTTEYYTDNSSPNDIFDAALGDELNISSPMGTTIDSTTLSNDFKISTRVMVDNRNSFVEVANEATNDTGRSLKTAETFQPTTPRLKSPSRINTIGDGKRIGDAILNFSMVYSSIMFNHDGNVITSPTSIALLILLTSYGACPPTSGLINIRSHLPNATQCNLMFIESFIKKNSTIRTNGMLISHTMFMPDNIQLSGKFMAIAEQVFELNLQYINFNDSEKAAQIINNWSANQTDHKITDAVDSHHFNDETGLVLISVAYFNCDWLIPFDSKRTKLMNFYVNDEYKKVWTMKQKIKCYYGILQPLDASPYVELLLNATTDQGRMRMIIILPSQWSNLSHVVSKLPEFQLKYLHKNAYEDIVDLSMPKFKIKSKIDLKNHQNAMRMGTLFSNKASFKRITKSRSLKVSDFIQMSIIDVNEGSQQFNHSTDGFINRQHSSTTSTNFHVDRPFIVLIANNDRIFASAQVTDPSY